MGRRGRARRAIPPTRPRRFSGPRTAGPSSRTTSSKEWTTPFRPTSRKSVIEWATYIVPSGLTKDTWITSLEIKPSELSVTHHICISFIEHDPDGQVQRSGVGRSAARRSRRRHRGNGINNLVPPGALRTRNVTAAGNDGCYVPGKSFEDYRIFNAAKLIPAGSDVRVQIHYTPSGKESVDRPEIGVTIAKEPPPAYLRDVGHVRAWRPQGLCDSTEQPQLAEPAGRGDLRRRCGARVDDAAHARARERT